MKSFFLLLFFAFAISGCSSFSKTGRQQAAYEKYVRKSSTARMKQRSKLPGHATEMKSLTQPSPPKESSETSEEPEAVPRGPGNQ